VTDAVATPCIVVATLRHGTAVNLVGVSIFKVTMMMYLFWTPFNVLPGPRAKKVFRILDANAIYLLNAGTYKTIALSVL
jgi:hemolysin III